MHDRYYRRGSILGPLVLIALGLVFLLRHQIPGFDALAFVARYWPVLLIVWGLIRLIEHYFYAPPSPGGHRAGLSGGEVVLIVLVVIVGLGVTATWRAQQSGWVQETGFVFWDPFLHSYPFGAQAEAPIEPGIPVLIRGGRGSVRLVAGSGPKVSASVTASVRAGGQSRARDLFAAAHPLLRREGAQLVVLPAGERPAHGVSTDLQLTLPPGTPVTATLEQGDFQASGWESALTVTTGQGDIVIDRQKGDLRLEADHGAISVEGVQGAVTIAGHAEEVSVHHVSGPVSLSGEYSGDLDFAALAQGLNISTPRLNLDTTALPGSLRLSTNELRADAPSALRLRTRNKDIVVRDFEGSLRVEDSNGIVSVASQRPPQEAIALTDRHGDISLALPAASSFALDALVLHGSIRGDFGIGATQGARVATRLQVGGGGPSVILRTTHGAISLLHSVAAPATPAPPTSGGSTKTDSVHSRDAAHTDG